MMKASQNARSLTDVYNAHRDVVGLTPSELSVVVAVMAHEKCFEQPVTRAAVETIVPGTHSRLGDLAKRRWLHRVTREPASYLATARAWKELGVKRWEVVT